ncbi:sensor histidine kinase [Paenibacillus cisolokensis]|uniref:sensor histidine kinase n=1 Tax=Paenibacillus TaxID=44249 RepID=UPI000720F836|nr:sensor histidine kinase [Paenibacillus sp. 32O-W]ALS26812.1 histidine kinase [Paenibacillus sp. 32O-W]
MMVRLLRSSKWELTLLFVAANAASALIGYGIWHYFRHSVGAAELWWWLAAAMLAVSFGFGYYAAQRMQRRIDGLHLALKQAASGNLSVRLPEAGARSLAAAYREFNTMAETLEQRMQWLQQAGEQQIMREAASNEAAVLEERKRLARDLHDTVSQQLFAIHMSASSLPRLLAERKEKADQVLEQLIQMSTLAQRQMRAFIAQLRPMELEGRTLQEALDKWYPDYCRQNGIQGELDWRLQEPLSEAKEYQLFLIIQEAMANIVKHAAAKRTKLIVAETEHQVVMSLQDDGVGFRPDQVQSGSYGLSTMKERSQKLGGDTEIISKPGSGTKIRVTIPKYRSLKGT